MSGAKIIEGTELRLRTIEGNLVSLLKEINEIKAGLLRSNYRKEECIKLSFTREEGSYIYSSTLILDKSNLPVNKYECERKFDDFIRDFKKESLKRV